MRDLLASIFGYEVRTWTHQGKCWQHWFFTLDGAMEQMKLESRCAKLTVIECRGRLVAARK